MTTGGPADARRTFAGRTDGRRAKDRVRNCWLTSCHGRPTAQLLRSVQHKSSHAVASRSATFNCSWRRAVTQCKPLGPYHVTPGAFSTLRRPTLWPIHCLSSRKCLHNHQLRSSAQCWLHPTSMALAQSVINDIHSTARMRQLCRPRR